LACALLRLRGIPFYCYVHGEELSLAETSGELRRLSRTVLRQAAKIIANSNNTKRLLVERWGMDESKVAVVHPGVDASRFVPVERDPALRAWLGWGNRRVVLTVGALQKRKGQDMLIRALPAIRERCPDVLYVIVGEGWERRYLARLVQECGVEGAVQFRGVPPDEELVKCYQQCDVFALPNRQVGWDFEGFGIALIEAQACGKPVVAGASGGTRETLEPSVTGEIVSCETPEALATVVTRLLEDSDRRALMGYRARQWVLERFDWRVLAERAKSELRAS
jgi:phosphatidylinositol alpha-1,6-mannosyltransferase